MPDNVVLHVYHSGDEGNDASDDEKPIAVPKRFRGPGRIWEVRDQHPNLAAAKESMQKHNNPVVRRLTGRVNSGKTLSFYYHCVKRFCGCTKEWRLNTEVGSHTVTEEESTGDHINHEKEERNSGRGLSFDQVKIVDDGFAVGIKKPMQFIKLFERKAKLQLEEG
jgi:hypothetical protein